MKNNNCMISDPQTIITIRFPIPDDCYVITDKKPTKYVIETLYNYYYRKGISIA